MLHLERINDLLTTRELGRNISYYPFTDSTNDDVWELLEQGLAEGGHVVVTDDQRYGRGRKGRSWFSAPEKGLTFSVLLLPDIRVAQLGLISLAAGVALVDALEAVDVSAGLKWPNDVLVGNLKLGGVLIESRLADEGAIIVLGIGLNVNEDVKDFPKDRRRDVTSVLIQRGESGERELIIARILGRMEEIMTGNLGLVPQLWLERCQHLGDKVKFSHRGKSMQGKFTGIDEDGHGLVQTRGKTYVVTAGDLDWLEV